MSTRIYQGHLPVKDLNMKQKALTLLKERFGYAGFKPLQEEIISSVLEKKDTVVIMPTGGGKSVCYQIPALIFEGITVIVSPLISLMKDQIDQLSHLGIPATMLNSSLDSAEYNKNMSLLRGNNIKLLYCAPETLMKSNIIDALTAVNVDCIAVDEAHCISDWGHDFRPEYRQIVKLRAKLPSAACIALTATATPRVQDDIRANLKMKNPSTFIASFNRENLFFQVKPKQNASGQILEFLEKFPDQSGIIYCFSRGQVDALSAKLSDYGYSVKPYHAGLSDEVRSRNQELFLKDEVQIIVATIAFGMGIHKTNVRFVIHHDIPKSIESYYQEIGRAGRDGLSAHCLLLYSYADVSKIKYFIDQKENFEEKEIAGHHLSMLIDYAEAVSCRRIPLITYFGENYSAENCGMCDNCIGEKTRREDVTLHARMFLSCIKRTNEGFGTNHIIDILRGSESRKILDFGHQNLTTYGIGKEYSKKYWQHLAQQCIREGAVSRDSNDYGTLKITKRGYEIMKGADTIHAASFEESMKTTSSEKQKSDHDQELFELLRKKRKELAVSENVPPYIIFSDRTLFEMATYFPQHKSSMIDIYGIGTTKYELYGEIFIELIKQYCASRNIAEKYKTSGNGGGKKSGHIPKYITVTEEYNNGKSVQDIASSHQIKTQTTINHLYDYVMNVGRIDPGPLEEFCFDDKNLELKVLNSFKEHGVEKLKAVYDSLNGEVDYETLAVYRVVFLCRV
jgi:ATP-dependent DNA helicase RecQ